MIPLPYRVVTFRISIDIELQQYAEKLMQNKRGSVVAIDPRTGEILVMVSSPSYDPNLLSARERGNYFVTLYKDTNKPLFNRPIMAAQNPPGSTFKPLQALIGLQEHTLRPTDGFHCGGGYRLGNLYVHCDSDHPHAGAGNLAEGILLSCNILLQRVQEYFGEPRLQRQYGFSAG